MIAVQIFTALVCAAIIVVGIMTIRTSRRATKNWKIAEANWKLAAENWKRVGVAQARIAEARKNRG